MKEKKQRQKQTKTKKQKKEKKGRNEREQNREKKLERRDKRRKEIRKYEINKWQKSNETEEKKEKEEGSFEKSHLKIKIPLYQLWYLPHRAFQLCTKISDVSASQKLELINKFWNVRLYSLICYLLFPIR